MPVPTNLEPSKKFCDVDGCAERARFHNHHTASGILKASRCLAHGPCPDEVYEEAPDAD